MIYTKTGDDGTTSLIGGTRVAKNDVRVEAYGTVDELNAHIGLLGEMAYNYREELKRIQRNLFTIQTLLACEDVELTKRLPQMETTEIDHLEQCIDQLQSALPPLKSFVLPGGSAAGAQSHVARTVCRRAERRMVDLKDVAPVPPEVMQYVNRLSDYLFVLSRRLTLDDSIEDYISVN